MRKYKLYKLFPLPLYVKPLCVLSEDELTTIRHCCTFLYPNRGRNYSTVDKYLLDQPKLKHFKKFLQDQVNTYAHSILHINKQTKFYITQSWANVTPRGAFHHSHHHPNSIISGVFFVTDNSNKISFKRNFKDYLFPGFEFKRDKFDLNNCDSYTVSTKKNTLLLFPSQLEHDVEDNKDDHERITISFNTFVGGLVGKHEELTQLKL